MYNVLDQNQLLLLSLTIIITMTSRDICFVLCFGLELSWIQKHKDQFQCFTTTAFLEEMLTHLRNVDMLSSAEETKIKEAGRLQDQVNMFTTIVTGKDGQASDALRGFIESSDSQVAQLILHYGTCTSNTICFLCWSSKSEEKKGR